MLDARQVIAGSALLLGGGLITLDSAAREAGIPTQDLLQEARNRGMELRVRASGWEGTDMPANALDFDYAGALVLDWARDFPSSLVVGELFLPTGDFALITDGNLEACLFFRDRRQQQAVVFPLPGVSVPVGALLIEKADAEAIQVALAKSITPAMLEAAAARVAPATLPAHKYARMKASDLVNRFMSAKAKHWSEATKIEMKGKCGAFVDLMGDPALGDIDGGMVLDYEDRLLTVPANIHLVRLNQIGVPAPKGGAWTHVQVGRVEHRLAMPRLTTAPAAM